MTNPQPTATLTLPSGEVALVVRRTARARRVSLRVRPATREVVLTVPPRAPLARALAFARGQGAWIEARLAKLGEDAPFADGGSVPLRGVPHAIRHASGERGTRLGIAEDGTPTVFAGGAPEFLARRVADFLKREARADLAAAVARYAAALGARYGRISLKDTASRWGSCTASGALSFSWRLVMAPPEVLDYLAAHEVAHLKEMNHSPRFHAVLDGLFPAAREAEAWLKAHGAALHRHGPRAPCT